MRNENVFKNFTNDIQLPNDYIKKIIDNSYYEKSITEIDNSDVNINHFKNNL